MRLNPAAEPSGVRACPQCGIRFRCGAEAGEERCWCVDYPAVAIDAALPGCLCPACLEERAEGTVGRVRLRDDLAAIRAGGCELAGHFTLPDAA